MEKMKPPTGTSEAVCSAFEMMFDNDWKKNVKMINHSEKAIDSGYILAPYKTICTHVEISGTKRIRQVSRWYLLKYWIYKNFKIDLGL